MVFGKWFSRPQNRLASAEALKETLDLNQLALHHKGAVNKSVGPPGLPSRGKFEDIPIVVNVGLHRVALILHKRYMVVSQIEFGGEPVFLMRGRQSHLNLSSESIKRGDFLWHSNAYGLSQREKRKERRVATHKIVSGLQKGKKERVAIR